MKKINQKIIALILTILLISTNLISLGNQVIALTLVEQNDKTNNNNVTFDSYLEGNVHSKSYNIDEEAKVYLKLNVYNTGYLKNIVISISNTANYEIDMDNLKDENILSASKNQISVKQINSEEQVILELPIKIKTANKVEKDFAEKVSEVSLNAIYVDNNGIERNITKTISNQIIWKQQMELNLNYEVSKYIPYNQGEEYGVLLQTIITSSIKDHVLPISKTELEMYIPQIENVKPEVVNVIANKTLNTNNDENGNNFNASNYKYEEDTDKLTITVNNVEDENNLISLNSNGVDEYIINCIYKSKDLYEKMLEKTFKASMSVSGNVTIQNSEQTLVKKDLQVEYNQKEAKGVLTDITPIVKTSISKGNIYANYDKEQDKKETNYEYSYIAQINVLELTNQVQMQIAKDYYLDNDSNKFPLENNSYIKQIKIEKNNFEKILSEEGTIEINKIDGTNIGTINKNTKLENNNYILDISEVKLQEIQIKTSKPLEVGNLEIKILKAITGEQTYSKEQIKKFTKIELGVINKNIEKNLQVNSTISLIEPVSKAEISVSEENKNLSTVVKNENVEIRVVLNTANVEYALYKNPVLEIELPGEVETVTIKDVNILLDDELKITNKQVITKNNKQVIKITLQGTQTNYTETIKNVEESVIAKGANIIINADITLNKFAVSKVEKITMYYTNENTNLYETSTEETVARGIATTNVNIVAPSGVSAINKITGYDNQSSELISLNSENKEIVIPAKSEKKTINVEGIITNNYENSIEDIYILGRLPFEGNKAVDGEALGSTFTMPMVQKIEFSGINKNQVKVYYSQNEEATKELENTSNEWKEQIEDLSSVKSYLIVISGEVTKGTQITFNYKVELPENVGTDHSSYEMYKVYYNNKTR